MNLDTLKNINQILERDSKDTTYKFALLRASIEAIQQKSPYINENDKSVIIPVGLLIIKWIEYYYPIIDANLPQKSGRDINFKSLFKSVTNHYSSLGGLSVFYSDFMRGRIDKNIEQDVFKLCKIIRQTIVSMPMKYIGYSIYKEHYQIYQPIKNKELIREPNKLSVQFVVEKFGLFSIPRDYFDIFNYLGSFLIGTHSIIIHWAEFTVEKSKNVLNINHVLNEMLKTPMQERNVYTSNTIFKNIINEKDKLECVWSGKEIKADLNIDHLLPFAVWKNNDLWNLLPTKASINQNKKDKIPSKELLDKSRDRIIDYWKLIYEKENEVFSKEVSLNLLGTDLLLLSNWEKKAFDSLTEKCNYLINTRGFEQWNYL